MKYALYFFALCYTASAAPVDVNEFWQGEATSDHAAISFHLIINSDSEEMSGTLHFPDYNTLHIPFESIEKKKSKVSITVASGYDMHFDGKIKGDTFTGTWAWPEKNLAIPFSLQRVPDPRPYTTEEITFTNRHDNVVLAGTLFLPKSDGPHPGIALVHGSGNNERWWRAGMADLFARNGVASIMFDKRGNGDSGGDWNTVGFEPLALDAVAALEYLKARSDIKADQLGLWGISQAGWIMPLAASLSDDVSFILTTSGGTINVEEEGYFDYIVRLRDAGFSEADQAEARALLEKDFQVSVTGEGYDEFMEDVREARKKDWWRPLQFIATPPNFASRNFYRLIGEFDPVPILKKVDIPILWVYGDADKSVEPAKSIAILEDLITNHDKDYTIRVFPHADHGIRLPLSPDAPFPLRSHAPGYMEALVEWLDEELATR